MSSNIKRKKLRWYERLASRIIKNGPIPRHVAFIMDGNRRYAKKTHIDNKQAHNLGYEKLTETVEWCLELGIQTVSVFAFSLENFKRSDEEVKYLMQLATTKFCAMIKNSEDQGCNQVSLIRDYGVRVRILGELSVLDNNKELQDAIKQAVELSKNNNKLFLNICFCYTAQHEINQAVSSIAQSASGGKLSLDFIDLDLLNSKLYTTTDSVKNLDVDILIRTSGETRLSDFMLYQSAYAIMSFVSVYWPEFSFWNLLSLILNYQRHLPSLNAQLRMADNVVSSPISKSSFKNCECHQPAKQYLSSVVAKTSASSWWKYWLPWASK